MNQKRPDHLTIKLFAIGSNLSIKALRLYDKLGLLKPDYIDPNSGYRYYTIEQLHEARLIRMMRSMDMPLATIRDVLETSPVDAKQMIEAHLTELRDKVLLAENVVQILIQTLEGKETTIALDVQIKTVTQQIVVSIKRYVTVDQLDKTIGASVRMLQALAQERGMSTGTAFGIYHGQIDHESDGPIEICLPTASLLGNLSEEMQARIIPERKVVAVDLYDNDCDFPYILKGYDALVDWIRQNGYQYSESPREIWHTVGDKQHMEIAWAFHER